MTFDRELAKFTLELSSLAYRAEPDAAHGVANLGLGEFQFFDGGMSTQAFIAATTDHRYLAFRGTESTNPRDWMVDARFSPIDAIFGKVHSGFDSALTEVWDAVVAASDGDERPLTVTGHSLGGGLAILAASRLADAGHLPSSVYVFGCPRVGLADFRGRYDGDLRDRTHRVINHIDIVTRVPLLLQGFRAPGHRQYFDSQGVFHQDARAWHVIKDDLIYRFTNFRSIKAIGLDTHEIGAYRSLVQTL